MPMSMRLEVCAFQLWPGLALREGCAQVLVFARFLVGAESLASGRRGQSRRKPIAQRRRQALWTRRPGAGHWRARKTAVYGTGRPDL